MIGKILGNRYEILEEVGRGGMAVVYKAKCRLLNRIVAVKVLRSDFDGNEDFLKRFNAEAQAAASLAHPNIVSIYDVGFEGNVRYIVMEYVEGVTLKEYISIKKVLSWQEAVNFAIEICSGLSAAHQQNIIHRDIKPHNIIVTESGSVKVTDFGIARTATSSTVSASEKVLGSVHYFSPEQARGRYVDNKTDIYSLGIVLYEMLTGRVPYDGDTSVEVAMKHIEANPVSILSLNPTVPKVVEQITFKAMKKETLARYSSVDYMKMDLERALLNPNYIPVETTIHDTGVVENVDDAGYTRRMSPVNVTPTQPTPPQPNPTINTPSSTSSKLDELFNDDDEKDNKKDTKTIVLAVIASIVVVVMLIFVGLQVWDSINEKGGSSELSEELKVPLLLGMDLDKAKTVAQEAGFTLEIADGLVESDVYEDGTIAEQSPAGNTATKETKVITVKLAGTPIEVVTLDDYVKRSARNAKEDLEELGFEVRLVSEASDDKDIGFVVRQEPAEGTSVPSNSIITLYVGSGREQVQVPNIVGLSLDEARDVLEEAGLELGEIEYVNDNSVAKDEIITQGLGKDQFVNKGTAVSVRVSRGKPDVTKSIVVDISSYSDNQDPVTVTAEAQASEDSDKNSGSNSILQNVKGGIVSLSVTGKGTVTYKIYVEGSDFSKEFVSEQTVTFN